LNKSG
jgi:hypothetical protein